MLIASHKIRTPSHSSNGNGNDNDNDNIGSKNNRSNHRRSIGTSNKYTHTHTHKKQNRRNITNSNSNEIQNSSMVSFGLSSFRNNNNTINGQRRSSSSSSSSSARISPLHSKGMLILALVLLTESVTLTNAVRSVEAASGGSSFFGGPSASTTTSESSTCTMGSSSCPPTAASSSSSSQGGLPPIKNTLGAIGKRFIKNKSGASSIAECCKDFHRCSTSQHSASASSLLEECDFLKGIPRGGHVSSSSSATDAIIGGAAAAAAAVTATKNMPYNIPLNGWKIIFQIFLTTINVVCWLVPLKSKSFGENKLALSLANAFSGGVFLSLAFGHLIPECVHGFSSNTGGLVGGLMSNEATPYMLVLSGYMLIFFVEKVAFDAHGALHEMEHAQDNKVKVKGNNNNKNGVVVANGKNNKDPAQQHNSGRSAVILLAALAVHSILEMAALGLSDTFSDSALLTISIALHQPAESIALLVAFLKSGMPKNQIIIYLSIFSMMGPIGCGLGIMVNEFADPIVDSIMLAVVAGTFVYVGATEVIPEEFEDPDNKWKKFVALMSGIISIFAITQYTMTLGL